MAIQFKSEEQRKIEKVSKGKLHTVRTILMVSAGIAFAILFLYFLVCFAPHIVVLPLFFMWFLLVVMPSICTIGIIWTDEGYRLFVADVTNMLGNSLLRINDVIPVLWNSLIYVGIAILLVIISYGVISFLYYKKHKEDKNNFYHVIISMVMLILALTLFIVALVLLPNVKVVQL